MVRTSSGRSTRTRLGRSDPIILVDAQQAIAEEAKSESDNDSVAESVVTSTEVRRRPPLRTAGESSRRKQKNKNEEEEEEATQVIDEEEENTRRKKRRIQQGLLEAIQLCKKCLNNLQALQRSIE